MVNQVDRHTPENWSDGFGILPVEIRPSGFWNWLGQTSWVIHGDRLEIRKKKHCKEYRFSDLTGLEAQGTSVRLTFDAPIHETIALTFGEKASVLVQFIQKLRDEQQRLKSILSAGFSRESLGTYLQEVLGWRGRPYVAAVDVLLKTALEQGASDLHLVPSAETVRVTMRIAQELAECGTYPIQAHSGILARIKHLAGCHAHLLQIPQEGSWTLEADDRAEARLSVFPSLFGDRVSLRIIRPIRHSRLESLNWTATALTQWKALLQTGSGLMLITGPIGSGKTTALYATLSELANPENGILRIVATLEDPVEGKVPGICQSSLNPKGGLGLAEAFKYLLRQDPDIMALGEIRDPQCLKEALQAGLAGHLVLGTFHAGDPKNAVDRIQQMGLDPYMLKNGLRGILHLALHREACVEADMKGCPVCRGSGFHLRPQVQVVSAEQFTF